MESSFLVQAKGPLHTNIHREKQLPLYGIKRVLSLFYFLKLVFTFTQCGSYLFFCGMRSSVFEHHFQNKWYAGVFYAL